MITINDNDLPIEVAEKLIKGATEDTNIFGAHLDMFTREDLREIAEYLLVYVSCHPNGD